MEHFSNYSHAIAALGLWALLNVILGMISTRGRTAENRCDCGKPKRDYANPVYRADRAHMNAMENSGPFIAATLGAIMVGAAPFWVNVLASVFILARIAMAFVHIRTENQPMRSICFVVGMACILGLAIMTITGAFTG